MTVWARTLGIAALALGLTHVNVARGGDTPPHWVGEVAADTSLPAGDALVLLQSREVEVDADGRLVTLGQYAVRIGTARGKDAARWGVTYVLNQSRVLKMRAWVVPLAGPPRAYAKEDALDADAAPNDVYQEVRRLFMDASREVMIGSVFACEWTLEDRTPFLQMDFELQQRLPTKRARVSIEAPNGWRVDAQVLNHEAIAPIIEGTRRIWELHDQPAIEDEPFGPPLTSLVPRLAVSLVPDRPVRARSFGGWSDVSRWISELAASQLASDATLVAQAQALVEGTGSDLERIEAVGRFVQGIHYISIQTGLGRGGGYQPRPAVEVLERGYGDCKDKANLMCALLRTVGITAWLTLVYLGDRDYVRESWPTPQQFNHCIVAVPVGDSVRAPGVADSPGLGRLLFVDPTDPDTPVGELPVQEQGSLALVAAGERGGLLRLPTAVPGWDRCERRIDGALLGDGSVSLLIREETRGGAAADERRRQRQLDVWGLEGMLGAWLQSSIPGALVAGTRAVDDPESGRLSLEMSVSAPGYAQALPGGLMALRPVLVSRREGLLPEDPSRSTPVVFRREQTVETLRLQLPPGVVVDDLPPDTHIETDFGDYASRCGMEADTLCFERRLTLCDSAIPAERYRDVREFLLKMRAAEQCLVVIRRTGAASR